MFANLNPGVLGLSVPFPEGVRLAQRHGFRGVDLDFPDLPAAVAENGTARQRDLLAQHGLQPGAWNLPFAPHLLSEQEWRVALAGLPAGVAMAAALGATRSGIAVHPGSNERSYDENFTFHVARYQPVARVMADHGIRLALEFLGPETLFREFRYPFIRSAAGMMELARAIGFNCGLLLDAYHWHCAGGMRTDLAAIPPAAIVHVHVNDAPAGIPRAELMDLSRKLPCATGVVDLAGFMNALVTAGYDGPVTPEPFDPTLAGRPADELVGLCGRATRAALALR